MPFGLGPGESLMVLFGVLVSGVLPAACVIWVIVTLTRIRSGQQEILTRMAALERRLGGYSEGVAQ